MTRRIKKVEYYDMHDLESYASGQPGIYDLVDSRTMTCINAEMVEGLKYGGEGHRALPSFSMLL